MITCSVCEGKGGWTDVIAWDIGGPYTECPRCNGTGKVSNKDAIILWLWERAPEWYLNFLYERRKND